jgi:hypothetical protein
MHHNEPDALRRVLERLDGVKRAGRGYIARCPAHDDRNPSLSVRLGDHGRVLLKCHAGCEYAAIAAALELKRPSAPAAPRQSRGDGFDRAAGAIAVYRRKLGKEAARWHYLDALGEPIGVVLRWNPPGEDKTYRPVFRLDGRWQLTYPECRPLYALDRLAARQVETVYVVEGEKCAEVLASCGLLATTSPQGAEAPHRADWSPLAGREVVIVPDAGEPGGSYGREVASQLGKLSPPAQCVTIELPDRAKGESVDDLLADCDGDTDRVRGVVEELSRLAREHASKRTEPDRRPSVTLTELLDDPRSLSTPETIASGCKWFDSVQPFKAIERGAMCVIAAPPGAFKSTILLRLALGFAEGGTPVAWMAGEMSDRMRVRRLLAQAAGIGAKAIGNNVPDHIAKLKRADERLRAIGDRLTFYRAPIALSAIERAAEAAPVVVIDYLQLIRHADSRLQGTERLEEVMAGLEAIRQATGSTMLLAAAQGRAGSDGERHIHNAVRGSSSIEYTVDSLYALAMSAEGLKRAKESASVFALHFDCLKQREGEAVPFEAPIDGRTGLVSEEAIQ